MVRPLNYAFSGLTIKPLGIYLELNKFDFQSIYDVHFQNEFLR